MIKSNLQHLCCKTYELVMEGAADQKLANGGGGGPWGTGLPRVCGAGGVGGKRKKKKKKGCSLSIVLDSMEQSEPPAEDAINRLKAGWPGGRTARQPLLHFHIRRLFLLKQKV